MALDDVGNHSGDAGEAARLVVQQMGAGIEEDLIARPRVGHQPSEISHRAADDEHCRLLAHQLCGLLLEADDSRILTIGFVSKLGVGHRRPHLVAR